MKRYEAKDHTFVLCAYGESPYLEACLRSLLRQRVRSHILIATSTPNDTIRRAAQKYDVPLFVRSDGGKGIAADWNYAMSVAQGPLVTLAHQDDIYTSRYTQEILRAVNKNTTGRPLIAFSDYGEKRGENTVLQSRLLRIKRMLLLPLRVKPWQKSVFWRRRVLSLGNPICCPAVTYVTENLTLPLFENNMRSNIDWQAWERLSRQQGEFVYVPKALMLHRIHEDSTTSQLIDEDSRGDEDLKVLTRFWPGTLAKAVEKFYKKSESSNRL